MNAGTNWLAPFTEYADTGTSAAKKKWKTRGIEVISIYRMKYHPKNSNLLYAASADIGGMVSEDKGDSFRVSKAQYNSNYDYSFDENNQNVVYAASGNSHDWPNDWHANAVTNNGGIYKSSNKGISWQRLTPDNSQALAFSLKQILQIQKLHKYHLTLQHILQQLNTFVANLGFLQSLIALKNVAFNLLALAIFDFLIEN